jgi:hypothetical protein
MGDRVEGTYNLVSIHKHLSSDWYYLRHYQNRAEDSTASTPCHNSFGSHLYGPITRGFPLQREGIAQTGEVGALTHRAHAWVAQIGRQTALLGKPLDITAEYKVATGGTRSDRSQTLMRVSRRARQVWACGLVGAERNIRNVKAFAYGRRPSL